jgi:hypothetical protein
MRRNHALTGRWIRIVAVVLGILCVLGAVPRRERVVQNGGRNIGQGRQGGMTQDPGQLRQAP